MKEVARKHYTQVDGDLNNTDAVTLQRAAAGKTCLCVSNNDQPALALAQTAKEVWTIPMGKDNRNNFIGYNNISFIGSIEGLEERFFDILVIGVDCHAYPINVKLEGTIFIMSNKGLIKKEVT